MLATFFYETLKIIALGVALTLITLCCGCSFTLEGTTSQGGKVGVTYTTPENGYRK